MADTEFERFLAARFGTVVGIDEVGRGALAGPVGVGACVSGVGNPPVGLTDSKALTLKQRERFVSLVENWVPANAVAYASNTEIDELGIISGLRLAGIRALESLKDAGFVADVVLLDGSHDWLTPPQDLFSFSTDPLVERFVAVGAPPVVMRVKADVSCSVVAAASVLAKVARDKLMEELPDPGYGWASNKGYGSALHREAIRQLGVSQWHRSSWKLI